jgi:multimeric flavodoxin WrbA
METSKKFTGSMAMQIIILQSSNRKNGNTERVMELFAENLQSIAHSLKETLEIETIALGRNNLEMCLGCRQCFHKGEEFCPLKDELLAIRTSFTRRTVILSPALCM